MSLGSCIFLKQWPLAPNSPKWRITRANVSNASHSLANVGECIERRMYRVRGKGLANVGRMQRVRAKQGGEFGEFSEFLSQVVVYTKKYFFMYKTIQSTLAKFAKFAKLAKFAQYSPNLTKRVTKIGSILAKFAGASHKNLLNTRQIRVASHKKNGEFLASTRIRQIRRQVAIA